MSGFKAPTLPIPPDCEVCDLCFGTGQSEGIVCHLCEGRGHFQPPASAAAYRIAQHLVSTYGFIGQLGDAMAGMEDIARTVQDAMNDNAADHPDQGESNDV